MKGLRSQSVAPRAGAAPEPERSEPARALPALCALGAALVLAAPVLIAWGGWTWMTRTTGFAVRRVVVTGAVNATAERVVELSGARGANAFALDLAVVRRRVLADPWIEDAVVRRALPHELRITVVERRPEAVERRAGSSVVLDASGRELASPAPEGLALPEIEGLAAVAETDRARRRTLGAATLAALRDGAPRLWERAEALDVAEAGKLVLRARNCPPIWLSGPTSADEAAAFCRRENGIVQAIDRAAWVDARWRDRLYVMPLAVQRGAGAFHPSRGNR